MPNVPVMTYLPSNATLKFGRIQPKALAGQVGPGIFYLSPLSNVPYVRFQGAEGYEKIISWGEEFENKSDGLVSVFNDSYHAGEVVLGSGQQANYPMPLRVTIPLIASLIDGTPVPPIVANPPYVSIYIEQILDVRRARRAFLMTRAATGATKVNVSVQGNAIERYHEATTGTLFPGYVTSYEVPANTTFYKIPLGDGAHPLDENTPHALLDTITPVQLTAWDAITPTITPASGVAYFVLEYA